MNSIQPFSGFPEEGLHFLADLARNNNREWFEARKAIYRDQLMGPAQAFVASLGPRLQLLSPGITYDTSLSGAGSIFRIYRDTRFSKDKTPYRTHLGIVFWEGSGKKTDNPSFYIHIEPSGAKVMAGQHMFPKPMLDAYRDAVVDEELGAELNGALATVREAGVTEIGGEHYKRIPSGYDPNHPGADLLRHNGLYTHLPPISPEQLTSPDFVDVCFDWCASMAPLHHWLVKVARLATK